MLSLTRSEIFSLRVSKSIQFSCFNSHSSSEIFVKEYSKLDLGKRIHQISRKLGGQNVKTAIDYLENNSLDELCKFLLENYYDKMYRVAYEKRDSKKEKIEVEDQTNDQIINTILTKI